MYVLYVYIWYIEFTNDLFEYWFYQMQLNIFKTYFFQEFFFVINFRLGLIYWYKSWFITGRNSITQRMWMTEALRYAIQRTHAVYTCSGVSVTGALVSFISLLANGYAPLTIRVNSGEMTLLGCCKATRPTLQHTRRSFSTSRDRRQDYYYIKFTVSIWISICNHGI